jgi:predicted AlkP superfamily phosphohydrolase/phosphomutase
MPRTRQLLIGLDAMEWDLVQRWGAGGRMPVFGRLMREGFSTELATTAGQLPDTVWSCIYTGTNPAKFEKYFYVQYEPSTGDLKNVPDDAISAPPFWDFLSGAGRKVAILDAPKFRASQRVNGMQVSNWGAHATKTARLSNPPQVLAEIDRKFGKHPVGDCDKVDGDSPASLRGLRQRVLDGVHLHGEVFRWAFHQDDFDVCFANFSATHCAGHHFWHYHDTTHVRHQPGDPHGLNDTIEKVYSALDSEIGKLIDQAGPGARVLIFAGHGMGAISHASWNLMDILDLFGYGKQGAPRPEVASAPRDGKVNPWRLLKMAVPGWLQYAIKNSLPQRLQDELLFRWYAGPRDWKGRRAFSVPNNDVVGAIRLNVIGRDRHGIVEPGAEYERICRDIAEAIRELRDPATGRTVARDVVIASDRFHGPWLRQLPDITVLWEQNFPWNTVSSPRIGTLNIRRQDGRTGGHTPHGFVIAAGPGVGHNAAVPGASIYDLAPTILDGAGVSAPPHFDGKRLPLGRSVPERAVPVAREQ